MNVGETSHYSKDMLHIFFYKDNCTVNTLLNTKLVIGTSLYVYSRPRTSSEHTSEERCFL